MAKKAKKATAKKKTTKEEGKEEVGPSLHTISSETHQDARAPVTGKLNCRGLLWFKRLIIAKPDFEALMC